MTKLTLILSALILVIVSLAYAATPSITSYVDGDTMTLSMSDNVSISGLNLSIKGGAIKSATYTGAADKVAVYGKQRVMVYGLNADSIGNGEFCSVEVKGYGERGVLLADVVAVNADADVTPCNISQGIKQYRNGRSTEAQGSGKTVMRRAQ